MYYYLSNPKLFECALSKVELRWLNLAFLFLLEALLTEYAVNIVISTPQISGNIFLNLVMDWDFISLWE